MTRPKPSTDPPAPDVRDGNGSFYLLIAGAFAFLTVPRIAQRGMFLDGVTYASISRNLAQGIGSFWSPSYTATLYPVFHEHPPLGFALQAAAFAAAGDHLAVERTYTLLAGALTAVLIVLTWRAAIRDRAFDWLPLVFWLLPSTVTWAIVNNLLETTQTVFTTMAVLAVVRGLQSDRLSAPWGCAAGAAVVGAVLTKGPAGLFPIAAPVMAAAFLPARRSAALRVGAAMFATVGVVGVCLLAAGTARAALAAYVDQQVLASISGARGGGRWASLARHLTSGVIMRMALLTGLGWAVVRARGARARLAVDAGLLRWSCFFLAVGLCGSVPTVVSARIMGHYLVPSIPMFALGFSGLALSLFGHALAPWRLPRSAARKVAAIGGAGLLLLSAALPIFGIRMEPRDREWMAEYQTLSPQMPRGVTAGTCPAAEGDWGSHAYLQRFFRISLDVDPHQQHRYFIQFRDRPCEAPSSCHPLASTSRLGVLECAAASR
jgi:4-amino-4-deoxy-L-arabinose transferase-like glycosyltransferase